MTEYRVTWEIDIEADTPEEAAHKARAIQQDPDNIASVFSVKRVIGVNHSPHGEDTISASYGDFDVQEGGEK